MGPVTQEDPIGIAGGLNLYGYANGDPINYSDPFGLCPPWPDCIAQGIANWGAKQGGAIGSLALNTGAALNGAFEAFGINDAARGGEALGKGDVLAAAGFLALTFGGEAFKGAGLVDGIKLPINDALDAAGDFLGAGYRELESGRFVSGDGLRQVRMMVDDITGAHGGGPHMNFETKTPVPGRPGRYTHENIHVYLTGR